MFIYNNNLYVVVGRKKGYMNVESTTLAGQRETCNDEKKRADTDLEFSSWFSVVVLTCLSTGSCLV